MSYTIPSLRARRIVGAVATVAPGLSAAALAARAAACNGCGWNVADRCQHPAQTCPPCKQGQSLSVARLAVNFNCPANLFPKNL